MLTKLFYDSEFTGLHQHTTLISIGLIDENERRFYAEFSDYNREQCDDWIINNVIANCTWLGKTLPEMPLTETEGETTLCFGDTAYVTAALTQWLLKYEKVEIWSDCLAYDWVLFCQLFGGALNLPKNIFYMPMDLVTLFHANKLDPDTNRESFVQLSAEQKHNALWDAQVLKACYQKLITT